MLVSICSVESVASPSEKIARYVSATFRLSSTTALVLQFPCCAGAR